MMMTDLDSERDLLSPDDWKMILKSLNYTRINFENYDKYPTEEYKRQQVHDVSDLISRINNLLNA